jgi:hypothetical protein
MELIEHHRALHFDRIKQRERCRLIVRRLFLIGLILGLALGVALMELLSLLA